MRTIRREAGFDLTTFGTARNFQKVLNENKLTPRKPIVKKVHVGSYRASYRTYVWKGKGLEMRTGNNPITGAFSSQGRRPREKGYASYIGIKGQPRKVTKLVKTIKMATGNIKGFNPKESEFIW